jgi:hypothetical protein
VFGLAHWPAMAQSIWQDMLRQPADAPKEEAHLA